MQTRRDQLHAYRFQNKRALAALVTGEPNVLEPPMRRLTAITISGIMVAVVVGVIAGLVGLINPATGDAWKQAGVIIDERSTGARYILYPHNVLHPVLNYSSAVLIAGASGQSQTKPHVEFVDSGDLKSTTRGSLLGIPGLPDSLPGASSLITSPFTVCSRQQSADGGQALQAKVSMYVGSAAGATNLAANDGAYVQAATGGQKFLLADGRRYAVTDPAVATALQITGKPLQVSTAFLNSIPPGPALKAPAPPNVGQPSRTVSINNTPVTVGQLIHTTDDDKYYLALDDGQQQLDPVLTALFRTLRLGPSAASAQPVTPLPTTENTLLNIKQSPSDWPQLSQKLEDLPSTVPSLDSRPADRGGVCAVYRSGAKAPSLAVPASQLPSYQPSNVIESATSLRGEADDVVIASGGAALVRSNASNSTTAFLVADPGKRFAVPSDAVLAAFGYGKVTATKLPPTLVSLIPAGPPLSPTQARRPVSG